MYWIKQTKNNITKKVTDKTTPLTILPNQAASMYPKMSYVFLDDVTKETQTKKPTKKKW